jgi:hypothetical protein
VAIARSEASDPTRCCEPNAVGLALVVFEAGQLRAGRRFVRPCIDQGNHAGIAVADRGALVVLARDAFDRTLAKVVDHDQVQALKRFGVVEVKGASELSLVVEELVLVAFALEPIAVDRAEPLSNLEG